MAEDKPRLARLTAIITQLQSKRMVTARDIAEKYGISIRTVYRDIRTLQQSGIPIVTQEGKGYSMMDGYQLPPLMFTEEEAMALITAEQLILKNMDEALVAHYQNVITKIRAVLKGSQKSKAEFLAERIQIRDNYKNEKTSRYLIQLQSCIANFEVVHIDYHSLNDQRSQRSIEPFALYTTKDNWIMIAFCRKRQDFRAFRLDCIHSLLVTSEHFEPHDMTLEQYLEQCREKWENTPDTPMSPEASTFAMNQKNNHHGKSEN